MGSYATILEAQAAVRPGYYAALNQDGTFGVYEQDPNGQWIAACQYAYSVAGVRFPAEFYGLVQQAPQQPSVQARQKQKSSNVDAQGKKKIVAIVLLVLLGSVGGHDFYAGKNVSAFAHLVLFLAWCLVSLLGPTIGLHGSGVYAFVLLAANGIFVFVELIMLLVQNRYGECTRW